jgi:dienelactone hydrolase/HEAT repeat protein/ribosomal protein S27E
MSIAFSCQHCGRKYVVADHLAGKQIRCKQCGKVIPVRPDAGDTAAAAQAANGSSGGTRVPQAEGTRAPANGTRAPASNSGTHPASRIIPRRPPRPQDPDVVPYEDAAKVTARHRQFYLFYRFLGLFEKMGWAKGILLLLVVGVWFFWPQLQSIYGNLSDRLGWNKIVFGTAADLAKIPPPAKYPVLPVMQTDSSGIGWGDVKISAGAGPGQTMQLRVYVPSGEHKAGTLPCVLMAPARSILLAGGSPSDDDSAELQAYAQKGFVAVCYSMDGELVRGTRDLATPDALEAVKQFMKAKAGLVNARNALAFVLSRIPEVDPGRIYCVGRGSAATTALVFAAYEGRIKGCAVYGGVYDIPKAQDAMLKGLSKSLATAQQFFADASPAAHAADITCPVYLFHAEDDPVRPARDTRAFAEALKQAGKRVQTLIIPKGGHREAILAQGIPSAIRWLTAVPTLGNAVQTAGSVTPDEAIYHDAIQPAVWSADAEQLSQLDAEVSIGPYTLRPPKGLVLSLASENPKTALDWSRTTGAPPSLSIRIVPRKNDRQKLPWLATAAADLDKHDDLFTIVVSEDVLVDRGAINGLTFTRVTCFEGIDKRTEKTHYAAADDENWISVQISGDEQSAAMALLHAAVRTIRKSEAYLDPYAPAAVAPRLADDPEHAAALLRQAGPAAETAVDAQLKNPSPAVRKLAAQILTDIGTPVSLPALGEAARDKILDVALAARAAWRKIDPKMMDDVGEAVLDLTGEDPGRKLKALQTLAAAQADDRKDLIAPYLMNLALGDDEALRAAAVKALLVWKVEQNSPQLIALLKPDGDPAQRKRAIDILIQLKDKQALAPAIACIPYDPAAVDLLAVIGSEKDAQDLLNDTCDSVRIAACRLLGEAGTLTSLDTLVAAGKDSHPAVAAAAKAALAVDRAKARAAHPQWTVDHPIVRNEIVIAAPTDPKILDQLGPPVKLLEYSIRPPNILRPQRITSVEERAWDRPKKDMSPGASLSISVRLRQNMDLAEPKVVAAAPGDKTVTDAVYARNGTVEYAILNGWKMLRVSQDLSGPGISAKRVIYAGFDGDKMVEVTVTCVMESDETFALLEAAAQTLQRPKR